MNSLIIELRQNLNLENVKRVENGLKEIDHFKFELVLPNILVLIDERNKDEINIHLISCVKLIVEKSRIRNELAYKTLLVVLMKLLKNPSVSSIKPNLSEELKLSVIEGIEVASKNLNSEVIEKVFDKSNVTLLAQCIFICVEIVSKEKYRKLRLAGIRAIMGLTQTHDNLEIDDIVLRDAVSRIIFVMLPKIIAVLIDVTQEETIKGHSLISTAVKALGRIICLIMEDYDKKYMKPVEKENFLQLVEDNKKLNEESEREILGIGKKSQSEKEKYFEQTTKSEEWLQAAAKKLAQPLLKLKRIRSDCHMEVRMKLAKMSFLLLERCYLNVKCFSSFLLENLILLTDDENANVREFSQKSLETLITNNYTSSQLKNSIFEIFHSLLISLPRIIHSGEEQEQLSHLTLLNGFIKFTGLSELIENSVLLEKLIGGLLICAELEIMNRDLFHEKLAPADFNDDFYHLKKSWKKYKNLLDIKAAQKFEEVCKNIGKSTVGRTILNCLMDDLSSIEHLVLLIAMLDGSEKDNQNIPVKILEELLDDSYWEMPIETNKVEFLTASNSSNSSDQWFRDETLEVRVQGIKLESDDYLENKKRILQLKTIKYNILCTCLVLETTAAISTILREEFQSFLLKILHRILMKAGNNNFFVQSAAIHCLEAISTSLGLKGIGELLAENSDFLLFHIEKMLRKDDNKNSTMEMIVAVFKHSDSLLTPHLEKIIQTLIVQIQEKKYSKHNCLYLELFKIYVTMVYERQKDVITEVQETSNPKVSENLSEDSDDIENFMRNPKEPLELEDFEKIKEEMELNCQEEFLEEIEEEVPVHISLTKKIFSCTNQFFASKDNIEAILAHEIFIVGLPILKNYENILLPVVHQLWYPFIKQFQGKNFVVLQRSVQLLAIVAELAKDFIYKRSLESAIPSMNKFLIDALKNDPTVDVNTWSQRYKLQKIILENYGNIAINIGFEGKELNEIVEIVEKYVKKLNINEELRSKAQKSLDTLNK